jgi:hypothetical protein
VQYGGWDVDVGEMSVDNANGRSLVPDAGWHFRKRTRILRWSTYELLLSPSWNDCVVNCFWHHAWH